MPLILVPRRGSGPYLLGPSVPRERFPSRTLLEEGGRPYLDAAAIPHKCGAPCKRRFHREVHAISGPPFGRVDRLQQITDLWLDIWLRITFGVVFASSLVLGSRTCLQDSAASFYARMSLAGDDRRQVVGGPSKFLQLIQKPNNSSDLKFEHSRSHARAYRDKGRLAAD